MASSKPSDLYQDEIDEINERILKVREELLAMEKGDFSLIHKK